MKGSWKQATAIARKELGAYFGSPMALIFVGAFLVATLFAFFWGETFFARGVADVRPLFKWMPILLIFLVAALTMRQWSEEQRAGTLEVLLTLPVRRTALVAGKFLAVMALVVLSLVLTLFLPITVSLLGSLDWGPVLGGYLAAILMASAYTAIGLYVSSRTDNQIVSLLVTLLVGGALYLVGTAGVTRLFGDTASEILRSLGTGSRFESIERGVIDLRDLVYYLSLAALFLVLNVVSLDSKRWSRGSSTAGVRWNTWLRIALVGANLLALNAWIFPLSRLRADMTAQHEYSLSPATVDLIKTLNEPLLMRGYFSERTHPLLAPLVPTLRDIMSEYQIASGGKINVEIVDPAQNPDLEAEANDVYGIKPTPFRVAGRYEESVISSYFTILLRYGDQNVTLGFNDLIEIKPSGSGDYDVGLRNPEYDLTRSIKKVVYGFQSLDAVFATMKDPVKLTAYVTPKTLPADFQPLPALVEKVAKAIESQAGGKFTFETVDLDAADGPATMQKLYDTYGMRPFSASLLSQDTFYMHLLLEVGTNAQALYPDPTMTEADIRSEIEAALRRAAPGFLKTVGVWSPSEDPVQDPFGGQSPAVSTYKMVRDQLAQNYTVTQVDLSTGRVPGDVDVLLLVAPQGFTDKERFAVDQYLMRGGSVIVATSNYTLAPLQLGQGIMMDTPKEGLNDMLEFYGVRLGTGLVMDPQNEAFPMQVPRKVGTSTVVELQQVSYPFFVDVRQDGMNNQSVIVSGLPAVTLQWVSPLEVDPEKNKDRQVVTLLKSTKDSWIRSSGEVNPDRQQYPQFGFPVEGEQAARPLAVSIRGSFQSYFKDHPSPFQGGDSAAATPTPDPSGQPAAKTPQLGTVLTSPESARLVVIGSAEFLDDTVLQVSQSTSAERYLNNLQLVQNAVDWAVEDEDLLSIRSRGAYARLLRPLTQGQQSFWEGVNYVLALVGLVALGWVWNSRRRHETPMTLVDARKEPVQGEQEAMKKLSRPNLILLAALGLQVVLIVVAFWPRQATSAGAGKPLIAGLTADQLVAVTVRDMDGNEIHIAKKADQWVLPAADDFAITAEKGTGFADKLVALKANRLVAQTETSLKRLKVADDDYLRTLEIELADGTKQLLYVGTSPSWSVTHVRISGQKEVYLVSGLTISDVDTSASSWIDTKLFAVEADSITGLTVQNAAGTLELTRGDDGKWLLKDLAAGETLDDSKVSTLVNRVASIYMQRPLGNQPKPEYGLDKPAATVTVQTKDKDGKAGSYTVQVGAKGADGASYTLLASQSPYYVQVADYTAQEMVTWGLKDLYVVPTPAANATVQSP